LRRSVAMSRACFVILLLALLSPLGVRQAQAQGLEEKLNKALGNSSFKIRLRAAILVGKKKITSLGPKLQKTLYDEHDSVRAAAALSLGRIGAQDARSDLAKLLAHPKKLVHMSAEKALVYLDKARGRPTYLLDLAAPRLPKNTPASKGQRIARLLQAKLDRQTNLVMEAGESKALEGIKLADHLKARKLKGMSLRPKVLALGGKDVGGTTTLRFKISIMVVSLVKQRMEFAGSGEAEADVDTMDLDIDTQDDVERQLIEAAVEAALQQVLGYLARRTGP